MTEDEQLRAVMSRLGKIRSEAKTRALIETQAKGAAASRGLKRSAETREKMRLAQQARRAAENNSDTTPNTP